MKFDSGRVAFGRHETFGLRYSWLSKGFQTLMKRPDLFDSEDAIVELGVGKNMVASIRYWLRACQLITPQKPDEALPIGYLIFDEQDGWTTVFLRFSEGCECPADSTVFMPAGRQNRFDLE